MSATTHPPIAGERYAQPSGRTLIVDHVSGVSVFFRELTATGAWYRSRRLPLHEFARIVS